MDTHFVSMGIDNLGNFAISCHGSLDSWHCEATPGKPSAHRHETTARKFLYDVVFVSSASTRHRIWQALVGLERGASCFNNPVFPDDEGLILLPYTGDDCLTYEGEINKMAVNVAFGR